MVDAAASSGEEQEDPTQTAPDSTKTRAEVRSMERMLSMERIASPGHKQIFIGSAIFNVVVFIVFSCIVIFIPNYLLYPLLRGFYCDDLSIRYPNKGSSVSFVGLIIIVSFLVIVPVLLVEGTRIFVRYGLDQCSFTIRSVDIIVFFMRFGKYVGSWLIGVLLNVALCRLAKYSVGRLRPDFIDCCRPEGEDWDSCVNNTRSAFYVQSYSCVGVPSKVKDARMSFYSGHASIAMHSAAYIAMYLQERLPRRVYCYSIRPLMQFAAFCIAFYIGFTRVHDHRHFLSDVLVGFCIGFATALYSGLHFAIMFHKDYGMESDDEESMPLLTADADGKLERASSPTADIPEVLTDNVLKRG